jgi:hypothetical protein
MAVVIALAGAGLFEYYARMTPVPPGGDNGTWIAASFPYVGLPGTFQEQILSYPPASFPFIGLAVRATGSPLTGGLLFSGIVIAALGLTFYELSLAVVELRSVALLAEAAFFVQPDFQQLYYFGSYPNMFGLVFFFLALAFGLRFLRSRRPLHLAVFWGAATVAVLAHALVAILLVEILVLVFVALLVFQRLPREFFGRVGLLGLAVFFGSGAGYYYLGPRIGFSPPNYITSNVLTSLRSQSNIPSVFKPFYLEPLSSAIRGSGFSLTASLTIDLLWGSSLAIIALVLLLRWLAPGLMTHRVLIMLAWILGMFLLALGTWYVGISTDYRRFAYMLYPVTILGAAFVGDMAVSYTLRALRPPSDPPEPAVRPWRRSLPAWRWRRWDRRQVVLVAASVAAGGLLLFSAYTYTVPGASNFETFFAGPGHDGNFTAAMAAIAGSNQSGSIFSTTGAVDRWPSTLTARPIYEARPPTGYTYTPENLYQDELANLILARQYTVANNLVSASLPGYSTELFNASPVYDFDSFGVIRQVYEVVPATITVTLVGHPASTVYDKPKGTPLPVLIPPLDASTPSMALVYNGSGFEVMETIDAVPNSATVQISLSATAQGSARIQSISEKLASASGGPNLLSAVAKGSNFTWVTNTTSGNYTTTGVIASGGVISSANLGNASGKGSAVTLSASSPSGNGSVSLNLTFTTSTPSATNTINGVGGFYSGAAILANWDVRFLLLESTASSPGGGLADYFEILYGYLPFVEIGEWWVLVAPT